MSEVRSARRLGALVVLFAVAAGLAPGCGKKSNRLPVFPAKGQVLVGGKPAKGVFVYLWPASAEGTDAYCPNGQTDDAGNFTLSTYDPGDGAPAGDYKITAEWPARFNVITNRWEGDKLKGKFTDSKNSAFSVTIKKEPNELPPISLPE